MSCEEVTFLGGEEGERGKWLLAYLAKEMTDGHCADGGRARATEIRLGFVFRKNAKQRGERERGREEASATVAAAAAKVIIEIFDTYHPPLFL